MDVEHIILYAKKHLSSMNYQEKVACSLGNCELGITLDG